MLVEIGWNRVEFESSPQVWGGDFLLRDGVGMINKIRIELNMQESEAQRDNANVVVETDDGIVWQAPFVTISFLQRQMYLSRDVAKDLHNMAPVRFIAIETPHVIVENLLQDTIEDTIDNLMTLGIFESVFVRYSEEQLLKGKK
jgi:hypothetical protein